MPRWRRAYRQEDRVRHLQAGDVADSVVLVRAVAPDARVQVWDAVHDSAVRGSAGARVATDVPCGRRRLPELDEDRLQRARCKQTTHRKHGYAITSQTVALPAKGKVYLSFPGRINTLPPS